MKLGHWLFKGHLDDDEYILEVIHRHPLVLKFSSYKTFFLGIVAPIVAYLLFPKVLLICIVWFFVGVCGMIYHVIDWFFDVWLLTNQGVVDIEFNGMFDRRSVRIEYHMIEGIGYNIKGVMATVFDYGDITIDKLGTNTAVVLLDAPHPKKIEKKVMYYQEKFLRSKSIRDHNALKNMLSEMIAYHVQNGKINDPTRND